MELINQKRLKGQNSMSDEQGEDRITNLPDALLHYVLSLLEIKEVVRTSVLSKRWYYIWASIPTLDLRSLSRGPRFRDSSSFVDIVDRILYLHDTSGIKKLSLCWYQRLNESRASIWFSAAIRRNVEELSLTLFLKEALFTPLSLCTCESLVTLELHISHNLYLPKYISFPKLKHFKVSHVKFSDKYNSEQPFRSCPVLENLILEDCEWFDMKKFCLSAPSLKVLKICSLGNFYQKCGLGNCAFEIDAPSLESLTYWGEVSKEYVMSNFLTLAEVDVGFDFEDTWTKGRIDQVANLSKFLRALSHVKCLTISHRTLQVLSFTHNLRNCLPTFHSLKKLNMSHNATNFKALFAFLRSAPNLESLIFCKAIMPFAGAILLTLPFLFLEYQIQSLNSYRNEDLEDVNDNGEDTKVRNNHLLQHLKSVCFKEFYGFPSEMKWVRLILQSAPDLETMTFCPFLFEMEMRMKEQLMVEVTSLPRLSKSCVFNLAKPVSCC